MKWCRDDSLARSLFVLLVGCSSPGVAVTDVPTLDVPSCFPGQRRACFCDEAQVASQTCLSHGSFEPCPCAGAPCAPGRAAACSCGDRSGSRVCGPAGVLGGCVCTPEGADAGRDDATLDAGVTCEPVQCGSTDAACGVVTDRCGATHDCGPCGGRALGIHARRLAFDEVHNTLYATVGATDPRYPNRVIAIDPQTLDVSWSVEVGVDPEALALSDDGTRLWVGVDSATSVRSIELPGRTLSPLYRIPDGDVVEAGPAEDIVVLPGAADTIAVSVAQRETSTVLGVTLFDRGVARPMRGPRESTARNIVGGPPGYLFGFNRLSRPLSLIAIDLRAEPIAEHALTGLGSFFVPFEPHVRYDAERLLATDGTVLDVSTPTRPRRLGRLPAAGVATSRVRDGEAYVLSPRTLSEPVTLRRVRLDTFMTTGATVANVVRDTRLRDLTRLSPTRFAVVGMGFFDPARQPHELYVLTATWSGE